MHRHLLLHLMLHLELLHRMLVHPHGRRGRSGARHWSYTRSHLGLLKFAPLFCLKRLLAPVVIGDAIHSHNNSRKISSFGNCILNKIDFHFVNSAAVQVQRAPSLHPLVAYITLEMPRPLVFDQNALDNC